MSYSNTTEDAEEETIVRKISLIVTAIIAAIGLAGWWSFGYWQDNWSIFAKWFRLGWHRNLFPHGWNLLGAAPLFWWIVLALVLIAWYIWGENSKPNRFIRNGFVVATAASLLGFAPAFWNNDKEVQNSYAQATTFAVANLENMPVSLQPLADNSRPSGGEPCDLAGTTAVYGCIAQSEFLSGWEPRSASFTGALYVMTRTSGDVPNTSLMSDTMSFLYGNDGQAGEWTAIRNGLSRQPIYGVVSWNGSGDRTQTCKFSGDNSLDYGFDGKWNHNLTNWLAARHPHLIWNMVDVWGFCDDGRPTIVIPVMRQVAFGHGTTYRPVGVLTIKGSPNGEPTVEHWLSVEPGDFPGPVYPGSLVNKQREAIIWAGDRANKDRLQFGYETTTVSTQAGNVSNYLLRGVEDGRLYWVTPLTPRSSDSQQLVAYSVTPADMVMEDELNRQTVYVVDDDATPVNLDDLATRVTQSVIDRDPGFFSATENSGRVAEFLPLDNNQWQVFVERGGRPVYRVVISADARIQPSVVQISAGAATGGETEDNSGCGIALPQMTEEALIQCLSRFARELENRDR